MINNAIHLAELNSPKQKIMAGVEIYRGTTLETTCTCDDVLESFTVERVGEGKFFGYGICQKLKVNLIDPNRELTIDTGNTIKIVYVVNNDKVYPYPTFIIKPDGISRDEGTNTLSITAYDALINATEHTSSEITYPDRDYYYYDDIQGSCARIIGSGYAITNAWGFGTVKTVYPNFDGTENLREVLDAIAEATQTIYFIDKNNALKFKQIGWGTPGTTPQYTIDRNKYYFLTNNGTTTLSNICHATELGDNVTSTSDIEGVTQYVRENAFWEVFTDIGGVINSAQEAVGGLTIANFESEWIGNYLIEIADRIHFIGEDGNTIATYLLDDTTHYDGTLSEETRWQYDENDSETASNPSNLGTALKKTYAKVDKVNKEIEIVASDVTANGDEIAAIRADTESITATVSSLQNSTETAIGGLRDTVQNLETQITQTTESVKIEIKEEIRAEGVESVTTTSGFTFDSDGLTIHEDGKEVKTNINNEGMTVYKNEEAVLTANEKGVVAVDLHAKTYLLIGQNSRLEDWEKDGSSRTACFWIGGVQVWR